MSHPALRIVASQPLESSATSLDARSPDGGVVLISEEAVPRGVSPAILLSQVRNTAPFLFDAQPGKLPRFIELLRSRDRQLQAEPELSLTHLEYFELCLAAHHGTVATFVPTDVDNQIRFKLWHPALPTETLVRMAELVLESRHWEHTGVSTRWLRPEPSEPDLLLSGHGGEWLSTAVAAYGALRRRAPDVAATVADEILDEIQCEAAVFETCRRNRLGIPSLQAATLIAHNLGDLDRVVDLWKIPSDDPLYVAAYRAGHEGKPGLGNILARAGELNKTYMAAENHRHFALRTPKCLRRSADLLLPIGPFFDHWGSTVARHPALGPKDVGEIADALVGGWERLSKGMATGPIGYARALSGIQEAFPGGPSALADYLPARTARTLKSGPLRALTAVSRTRLEDQWAQYGLKPL